MVELERQKITATNIGLAKAGQTEVIEHLCFYQHLCLISADGFQIPCLRQAPNRQAVKKPHFYFFSTSQEVYKLILS